MCAGGRARVCGRELMLLHARDFFFFFFNRFHQFDAKQKKCTLGHAAVRQPLV